MEIPDEIAPLQGQELQRIAKNMEKYNKLSAEYHERGFNYLISHYIKKIPELCPKFKDIISVKSMNVVI